MNRWSVVYGLLIALANLGILGALIGWNGGSRAYTVGLHTLFRDHLGAAALSWLVAAVLALLAARRLSRWSGVGAVLAGALAGDILAGVFVAAGIGEITYLDLPRVVLVETVAGSQLAVIAIGAVVGSAGSRGGASSRGARRAGEREISAGS